MTNIEASIRRKRRFIGACRRRPTRGAASGLAPGGRGAYLLPMSQGGSTGAFGAEELRGR